jgi:site-specific recombinase XerD
MGEPEINAYLTHLALKEHVSSSTQNQALSALLFLYRYVLGRELGERGDVIRARRPKRLPVVPTREEVKAVLAQLTGDKWLMASLMYGAGLRLMECLRLRVQDVEPATKYSCAMAKAEKLE